MIHRVCPECNRSWYSAATISWPCPECGTVLRPEHEKPLNTKENTASAKAASQNERE